MPKEKYFIIIPAVTYGVAYNLDKAIEVCQHLWENLKIKGEIIIQENEKITL